MKTPIYILLCAFCTWIGLVKVNEIEPLKVEEPKVWQPTSEGLMDLNSAKNDASKARQECKIEVLKAKEYINELKKDTIYFVDSE